MAGVAALATVAVFFGGIEPRNLKPKEVVEHSEQRLGPVRALRAGSMIILKSTWTVFRIRSFQVILAAGIVGEDPQGFLESTGSTTVIVTQPDTGTWETVPWWQGGGRMAWDRVGEGVLAFSSKMGLRRSMWVAFIVLICPP